MTTATIETVEDATRALRDAERALAAIHDEMTRGVVVTADELLRAEVDVRLATARLEAAERRERQQADDARHAAYVAAGQRLAAMDERQVEQARQRLAEAMDGYAAVVTGWATEMEGVRADLEGAGYPSPRTPSGELRLGGVTRRHFPFQRTIRDLAVEAVRKHFGPRQWFSLDNPPD